MHVGVYITIRMAVQPFTLEKHIGGLQQHNFMAAQPCALLIHTGYICINIFRAAQSCYTVDAYWCWHKYYCGYPALLSHKYTQTRVHLGIQNKARVHE